jgi:hypothetical protein
MVTLGEATHRCDRYNSPMARTTNSVIVQAQRRRMIDETMDAYVDWREECMRVWEAYQGWRSASRADSPLAFLAYLAALDREERASEFYAERISRLDRLVAAPVQRASTGPRAWGAS